MAILVDFSDFNFRFDNNNSFKNHSKNRNVVRKMTKKPKINLEKVKGIFKGILIAFVFVMVILGVILVLSEYTVSRIQFLAICFGFAILGAILCFILVIRRYTRKFPEVVYYIRPYTIEKCKIKEITPSHISFRYKGKTYTVTVPKEVQSQYRPFLMRKSLSLPEKVYFVVEGRGEALNPLYFPFENLKTQIDEETLGKYKNKVWVDGIQTFYRTRKMQSLTMLFTGLLLGMVIMFFLISFGVI